MDLMEMKRPGHDRPGRSDMWDVLCYGVLPPWESKRPRQGVGEAGTVASIFLSGHNLDLSPAENVGTSILISA